jgi:hypothetical protein
MISILVKVSNTLKPFHKLIHFIALIIIFKILYQFLFTTEPANPGNKEGMYSLLVVIWLLLINVMLHVFTKIPEKKSKAPFILSRIINKLHYFLYYILSLLFIGLSVTLIILSFKMMRV